MEYQPFKRASALYRSSEALGELRSESAILEAAARILVDEIGYVSGWIAKADEAEGVLRERALWGVGYFPGHVPAVHSLTDLDIRAVEVVATGKVTFVDDVQRRADAEGWGHVARAGNMHTVIYAPMRAGGKVIGVLGIGRTEKTVPEDEELLCTATFANQLASAIIRVQGDLERERQFAALEEAYKTQNRLLQTVRDLSTPVIPVHDGILVVPLVGTIESTRSIQVMEALLHSIQQDRASVVILDITGVPTVDTDVANYLLRSARAAAMLGAKCVLVGISPVVARTMVDLGVDLGTVITRNNLQSGIAYALSVRGLEIRPINRAGGSAPR